MGFLVGLEVAQGRVATARLQSMRQNDPAEGVSREWGDGGAGGKSVGSIAGWGNADAIGFGVVATGEDAAA